ncbi:MAG: TIM barrel protein, partial [Phycisphaerales bacterium]|nr:TIM barrel protein [Phycisphaerales bacterium]
FADRFVAARDCGFTAVEILSPYQYDIREVSDWLVQSGLEAILINIPPGEAGEVGTAAVPGRQAFFQSSFQRALNYATGIGAPMIHVLAGKASEELPLSEDLFVDNLRWAADLAAAKGIQLLLEPLNTQDVPGYLHTRTDHTAELIHTLNRENIKMQFDFYHMQIMEGNLAAGLKRHLDIIGHVQFSSLPGRHEPQYGEVNVHLLADYLDELGYAGWIGCEYVAKGDTTEGLSWGERYNLGNLAGR